MTTPPHGQVPEALRLAEQYDHGDPAAHGNAWKAAVCTELRRLAELEAQIEALSEVQALSAAPGVPAGWKAVPVNPTPEMWKAAKSVPHQNPYGLVWDAMLAASPTPPAEQQAQPGAVYAVLPAPTASIGTDDAWHEAAMRDFADRTHAARLRCKSEQARLATLWGYVRADATPKQAAPKAAPGEQDDHQILAITTAYEQGVGKGHQAYNSGKEIANPYSPAYRCDLAWQYGYKEGKEQAQREAKAAPQQEAQAPCGWTTGITWRPNTRLQSEQVIKITRDTQPKYGYTTPIYTAPQPAPAPLSECLRLLNSFEYEGDEDSQAKAFFKAHINEDWFFHVKNSLELALAAQGGKA